jgi:CheY-like chemotaxis protein
MMNQLPKILLVDDNLPFRHLIAAFLKKAGYGTLEASNGREAFDVLERETPQAVFLDLLMQPVGGFAFMQEFHHDIPVILITADDSSDVLARAMKAGFAGVLKKPVNETRIVQMAQRVVRQAA